MENHTMSTLKKRTRLAAVATATLSGASIFALATPAHAAAVPPAPINQPGSSATGGAAKTITVKFESNPSGEAATWYVAELYYFDSTNTGLAPTFLPYYGGQTGIVGFTPAVDGTNTITLTDVPAGQYKVLIWASNAFGKSFGSDAGPTTLWNGGRVPLSPAADKPIEVTTVETGTQAAIPNFKAYRPYASWDDMLQNEYMLWTGHNKKGEDITNGRHPRDDEFTFWRYNLAVKDYPTSYIDNTTWLDESLNPDAVVPITFTSWSWPDSWEQGKYNSYRAARLDWLLTDPKPGFDASVPPKPLSPHAPADANKDGYISGAEFTTAMNTASDWAFNDVLFDRREVWAAWMAEEASQTDGPAFRLYKAYFDRLPDYGGLSFWSTRLRTGGTLLGVSEFFLDSDEFQEKFGEYDTYGPEGATDAAEFVALIYRHVLDREPDGSGFAFWTRQLQTERYSPAEVLIGFSEAHEFRDKMHGRANAASNYAHLLGRVPTEKEYVLDEVYGHFFVDNPSEVGGWWWTSVSGYERVIDLAEFKTRVG
jgi:hypothetical protein